MKTKASTRHLSSAAFELCQVRVGGSLLDALRSIEAGSSGIALVVDAGLRLAGTITDGDVRRSLLQGATLESPLAAHMTKKFTSVLPAAGRAEVLDLMQARRIDQIPIVDGGGRLAGLHLLHEVLGAEERPNIAVIMAGGFGTRLKPVTEHLPKPMIKVAGRPILERLLLHLVGHGIRRVYLSVHYLGHVIENHFGDGARFGCRIEYLREKEPLGTGGALSLLSGVPREPLIVLNGDLITQADISAMLRHHESGGYVATMAVRRYGHQVPYGCVEVADGCIVRLEEKPVLERQVNAGIYVLNREVVKRVPAKFFPITNLLESCIARGDRVGVYEVEEEWLDVGQREQMKPGRVP